jgi:DNA-binding transcriptional ArsR family regulator
MTSLDVAFLALSDPTRRAILARLAEGEATVMQLAEPFELTQPAISRHLKVLERAGLIARRVEGAKRPCRLVKDGIEAIDQWLDMLRKALDQNYDRLDQVLAEMQTENPWQGGMRPPADRPAAEAQQHGQTVLPDSEKEERDE